MSDREEIAKEHNMSMDFVNWFFDTKKDGCGNAWFMMMAAMWESWKHLAEQRDQLAAENAARKSAAKKVIKMNRQHAKDKHGNPDIAESWACVKAIRQVNTPTSDAWQREQMVQVWEEAKALAKSALACDSADHVDFLFDGKIAQLRNGEAV